MCQPHDFPIVLGVGIEIIWTKANKYLQWRGAILGRAGPHYRARMARETLLKWLESHETSRDKLFGQPITIVSFNRHSRVLLYANLPSSQQNHSFSLHRSEFLTKSCNLFDISGRFQWRKLMRNEFLFTVTGVKKMIWFWPLTRCHFQPRVTEGHKWLEMAPRRSKNRWIVLNIQWRWTMSFSFLNEV